MKFNLQHHVDNVMKDIKLTKELRGMKPSEMDLRFFSQIHFGDTYNGAPNPMDGLRYRVIFYGNQPVYAFIKRYDDGGGAGSWVQGEARFAVMYDIARTFLKIQEIARRQFFNEAASTEDSDYITLDPEELRMLQAHPQYKDIEGQSGIKLIPAGSAHRFTVECSKRHQK